MSRNNTDNQAFWAVVMAAIILMGVVFITSIAVPDTEETQVNITEPIEVPAPSPPEE